MKKDSRITSPILNRDLLDRLFYEKKFEEIIAIANLDIQECVSSEDVYGAKAIAFERLGRLEEALEAYTEAIKRDSQNVVFCSNKGHVLYKLGRFDESIAAYDEAIRLNPSRAKSYYKKGSVLQKLGRMDESIAAYDEAIRLSPTMAKSYYNKSLVLRKLGRMDESTAAYDEAIRLDIDGVQISLDNQSPNLNFRAPSAAESLQVCGSSLDYASSDEHAQEIIGNTH